MDDNNYDNPAVEEQWCDEHRQDIIDYLDRDGVTHGEVGEWPAWHVAPYVSVWAIESLKNPGRVGWWAICGDLPTDYISSVDIDHPRQALKVIAQRWQEISSFMERGQPHPMVSIGSPADWPTLAPLLFKRAELLSDFAEDDELWAD
jgi:hypothetical protein